MGAELCGCFLCADWSRVITRIEEPAKKVRVGMFFRWAMPKIADEITITMSFSGIDLRVCFLFDFLNY